MSRERWTLRALLGGCGLVGMSAFGAVHIRMQLAQPWTEMELRDERRGGRLIRVLLSPACGKSTRLPLLIFGPGIGSGTDSYTWLSGNDCRFHVALFGLSVYDNPDEANEFFMRLGSVNYNTAEAHIADDMAFVAEWLSLSARTTGGALYDQHNGVTLIGGHSMSGGLALLAASPAWTIRSRLKHITGLALVAPEFNGLM
jgi:pimeloyl-ACP methyl ester carboxylesterase